MKASVSYDPPRLAAQIAALHAPALLESQPGFGAAGRWSFLAAKPRFVFEAIGSRWSIRGDLDRSLCPDPGADSLRALALLLDRFELGRAAPSQTFDHAPPFQGGFIGLFGYDLAPLLERIPRRHLRDSRIPDIRLGFYDTFVCLDHEHQTAEACSFDLLGEGLHVARRRLHSLLAALARDPRPLPPCKLMRPLESNFTRDDYLATVQRALDYIRAGDIFQVNLSQRFTAEFESISPYDLHARLARRSPAPFSAYLHWGKRAVVSASPEWFYQTRGNRIVTRPIKGTRPRGATPEADAQERADLLSCPKDRAELTMIIDLERNDLGRVCSHGSVQVVDPYALESFAQVHHLVATVEGRLRADAGPVDLLRALFPGGSITGAPKIRAMQIIDELERNRRSIYTGAIGYISRGASAFNIAIRTMLIEGKRASFQAGGGIVVDSQPEAEYEETLHKARGLIEVVNGWGMAP